MPNDVSSTQMTNAVNRLAASDDSSYPYLMQYQFSGNIFPSFSSKQQIPVDIRFAIGTYFGWTTKEVFYLQVKADWGAYPSDKKEFRDRLEYHHAKFDFFYRKADKKTYHTPDFVIQLTKVVVVTNKYLVDETAHHFMHPNVPGTLSFEYKHRNYFGKFPIGLMWNNRPPREEW